MILACAILLVLAVVVYTLFIRPQDIPKPDPVSPVQHLEERRARIYDNLRDLQFEFRVGKLSDADYQRTKLDLQKELAATLAEIDAIMGKAAPAKSAAPATPPVKPGTVCPHCRAKFDTPLKFCGECGKPMTEVSA